MPQYGLEYGRVVGISALLLCTDLHARGKGAASGELRPGGHRPGRA